MYDYNYVSFMLYCCVVVFIFICLLLLSRNFEIVPELGLLYG